MSSDAIEKYLDPSHRGRLVVVPNELRDAINRELDRALKRADAEAQNDREQFFNQILCFYDEHGHIPEISIFKRQESNSEGCDE